MGKFSFISHFIQTPIDITLALHILPWHTSTRDL